MVENVIQIKSGTRINVGANVKIKKNIMCAKKILFGILLHVVAKIIDDSVITCDGIINKTRTVGVKTVPTNFNEKKVNCKTNNLYILLTFLLYIIALSVAI